MKPYPRHQIEVLLEKFMAGRTTIEEESLLGQYFGTVHNVPAEWEDYKALFGYINRGLEGELLPETSSPTHRKWLWRTSAAAAACVALFFGATLFYIIPSANNSDCIVYVAGQKASENEAQTIAEADVAKMERFMRTVAKQNAAEEEKVNQFMQHKSLQK